MPLGRGPSSSGRIQGVRGWGPSSSGRIQGDKGGFSQGDGSTGSTGVVEWVEGRVNPGRIQGSEGGVCPRGRIHGLKSWVHQSRSRGPRARGQPMGRIQSPWWIPVAILTKRGPSSQSQFTRALQQTPDSADKGNCLLIYFCWDIVLRKSRCHSHLFAQASRATAPPLRLASDEATRMRLSESVHVLRDGGPGHEHPRHVSNHSTTTARRMPCAQVSRVEFQQKLLASPNNGGGANLNGGHGQGWNLGSPRGTGAMLYTFASKMPW